MSRTHTAAALAVTTAALAFAGCGGSKPQYCTNRSDLDQSIKDLGNITIAQQGGPQQLKSQLQTIESNAKKLVDSAKSDFPSETSAINSSVTALKGSLQALPSSPSAQQLAPIAVQAKGVVDSVKKFDSASNSKCS